MATVPTIFRFQKANEQSFTGHPFRVEMKSSYHLSLCIDLLSTLTTEEFRHVCHGHHAVCEAHAQMASLDSSDGPWKP
jgi:hypothetical protein